MYVTKKRFAISVFFLICFLGIASAQEIEDATTKIVVTPTTVINPAKNFLGSDKPTLFVTNKDVVSRTKHIAFVFDSEIVTLKPYTYTPPVYGDVEENPFVCNSYYEYIVNNNDSNNPNSMNCFRINDNNTLTTIDDVKEIIFEKDFKSGKLNKDNKVVKYEDDVTKLDKIALKSDDTITIDKLDTIGDVVASDNVIVAVVNGKIAEEKNDEINTVVSAINSNNKKFYYDSAGIVFAPGETKTFSIGFVPVTKEGKYSVFAYEGSADCLVQGTCTASLELDPSWTDGNYLYRQNIILNTDGIGLNSNVTADHVIMVRKTSSDTAFWSHIADGNEDVRFYGSDNATLLKYHYELFNSTDKNMIAWVKVTDTFTSATDLNIWMYYGNANSTDGQDEPNTYPATYGATWLFRETANTTLFDMTSNNNDGASSAVTLSASGKHNLGYGFVGASSSLVNTFAVGMSNAAFTLTGWTQTAGGVRAPMWSGGGSNGAHVAFWTGVESNDRVFWGVTGNGGVTGATPVPSGVPNFVAITHNDSTGDSNIFLNGVADGNNNYTVQNGPSIINKLGWAASYGDGTYDTFRYFPTVLTSDEIKLLYTSEAGTLQTFNAEEDSTSTCTPPASGDWTIDDGSICILTSEAVVTGNIAIYSGTVVIDSGGILSKSGAAKILVANGAKLHRTGTGKILLG